MPNNTDVIPLVVGLSLCGASAALLYIWFQTKSNNSDECDASSSTASTAKHYSERASSAVRRLSQHISHAATVVEPERLLECVIPNHLVPLVVGRSGANVRAIGSQTGCTINFRERDGSAQVCEIRGPSTAAVQLAADLVRREAAPPPIVTEQLQVPQSQCGVVVGRCGEALQEICRRSMAKVYVEPRNSNSGVISMGNETPSERMRTIKITGTKAHVHLARTLIEEKIRTEAERRTAEEATRGDAAPRSPREQRNNKLPSQSDSHSMNGNSANGTHQPRDEKSAAVIECAPASAHSVSALGDGQLEVYVSAIASPSRFWLQLVGPQSLRLDAMVADMTSYYQQATNRTLHKIADPYLGQIVAALFKYDGKWYRAEIVGILPNEFNPRNVVLDLYFVDFGDSEYVAPHEVYELRTDFLTLRFQAIECFLAHVRSTNVEEAEIWLPDAISRFEEITHVAQWRKMHARMVTTKERKYGDFARRENSPVPGVELYDSNDINIASMLLNEKFALSNMPETLSDDAMPSSSLLTSAAHTYNDALPKPTISNNLTSETLIESERRQMLSQSDAVLDS